MPTTNLSISLVAQNQAQKEITVNEALSVLDAILNRGAVDKALNTPAGSPAEGDLYIIGNSPTGAWAGKANHVTYYNTTWKFIAPNEGMTVWVNDENMQYTWDGAAWVSTISGSLNNLNGVGVNTTYDSTNKLSVKSDAVLFDHNGTNSQVKVNKNASANTASHLFQDNYSGRAEFGLIGDDNFQLKVSPDGSSWAQSFVVDRNNGNIDLKQSVTFTGAVAANSSISCGDNLITRPEIKDYAETLTSANSSTAYTIDLENGNIFRITMTGNCTYTFSNPPASGKGGAFTLVQVQDATGGRTTTWPASVKWSGGVAPSLTTTANALNILSFITTDGGTAWYGFAAGVDMR